MSYPLLAFNELLTTIFFLFISSSFQHHAILSASPSSPLQTHIFHQLSQRAKLSSRCSTRLFDFLQSHPVTSVPGSRVGRSWKRANAVNGGTSSS
ncbi:hypothetical protein HDV57DRAFT_105698 [Trichoderma longibrachiatum]